MAERRSRAEKIAQTTEKLVATARAAFARDGYAAASMDAITAEAGLTRGALYHHFGGKDGLLEAVVRQIDAELGARLEAVWDATPDKRKALRATCAAFLDSALDPETQRILYIDAPAVLGQRLRDMDEEGSIGALTEALEELRDAHGADIADTEMLARILNAAMIDLALWIAASPKPTAALRRAKAGVLDLLERLGL
ncbi:MAG: TetR/AcrR family transcriptional regulator [Alphaproteobacteria bacterium]|nr:TetR/AcrR family transcriptional regulator [Alphaproteobacteria bacterium]